MMFAARRVSLCSFSSFAVVLLALLQHASAVSVGKIEPLAGGAPSAPIGTCNVSYPMTHPDTFVISPLAFRPADSALDKYLIYSYDLPKPAGWVKRCTQEELQPLWNTCLERCNGLRVSSQAANNDTSAGLAVCRSAFLAYNVPAAPKFNVTGGQLGIGCRMFNQTLTSTSFVQVTNGTYQYAIAANLLGCQP